MIIASVVALVLALCGISITEAAPIGTRNFDVRSMRRLETSQVLAARNVHHSARSFVPGGRNDKREMDMAAPNVAREADEAVTNKGWWRERAVPRHVYDVTARSYPLPTSDEARPIKKGTIPVENVKKSEVPDNLARKSEPAVEARTAPQAEEQRRAEPVTSDLHHSGRHPGGSTPSNQSGSQDRVQRREEPSGSGITADHGPDSGKSTGNVNKRRSDSSPLDTPTEPRSLHVIQSMKRAWGNSPQ